MTDSLRDQLLGLGFKPAPKPAPKPASRPERKPERPSDRRPQRPHDRGQEAHGQPRQGPGAQRRPEGKPGDRPAAPPPAGAGARRPKPQRSRQEMDLAKAYAIRAQKEKEERIEAERLKQEQGRLRREAKAAVEVLLKDRTLNHPDADIARHFDYGGKIKRVHVTAEQLKALNAGELGVVQQNGRYLLVSSELLAQAEALFPQCIALKVDPSAPAADDAYADPRFQVPDDLVW
jgi:uncharacterized protein YaiL (DUF2058 family)